MDSEAHEVEAAAAVSADEEALEEVEGDMEAMEGDSVAVAEAVSHLPAAVVSEVVGEGRLALAGVAVEVVTVEVASEGEAHREELHAEEAEEGAEGAWEVSKEGGRL